MNELLSYRNADYFKDKLGEQFLVSTVSPLMRVCKLYYDKSYWFMLSGMNVKATSTKCVSLKELAGTKVFYKDHPMVQGVVGEFGVSDSPYLYVYWTKTPMVNKMRMLFGDPSLLGKPVGMPCALPDNSVLRVWTEPVHTPYLEVKM